jgi:hypothetical protein
MEDKFRNQWLYSVYPTTPVKHTDPGSYIASTLDSVQYLFRSYVVTDLLRRHEEICEISSCHSGKYEDDSLLGYSAK